MGTWIEVAASSCAETAALRTAEERYSDGQAREAVGSEGIVARESTLGRVGRKDRGNGRATRFGCCNMSAKSTFAVGVASQNPALSQAASDRFPR
jgi:hypothetical protein